MASSTILSDYDNYKSNIISSSADQLDGHLERIKATLMSQDTPDAKFKAMTKPLFGDLGVNTKTPILEVREAVFEKYAHLVRLMNTAQDMSVHHDRVYRDLSETIKILRAKQPTV